ncbi:hypothetical protein Dimus_020769 [Dionaea muscipula]
MEKGELRREMEMGLLCSFDCSAGRQRKIEERVLGLLLVEKTEDQMLFDQKQESEQRQSRFPTEAEAKQSKVAAIHTTRRAAARRRRRTRSKAAAANWEQSNTYSHHTARARRSKAALITETGNLRIEGVSL